MWLFLLIIVTILFSSNFCESIVDPIVETPYGSVEGFTYSTASGSDAEIFLGIPFAAPPIADLRFEVISMQIF
uniref:Carboxylesterase type B domain-containing protein n=1 Tax=Panagrolaimus superbus TaxID=310955 RepID=A0A914Z1W1_9BILA